MTAKLPALRRRSLLTAILCWMAAGIALNLVAEPIGRQIAKLASPNPQHFNRMGSAVAMDGIYAVVAG